MSPLSGTFNLVYNSHKGLHASTTAYYESGYRYGVGKWTYVFDANGRPIQVNNTDLTSGTSITGAYYLTDSSGNIIASRGTDEGGDPGTLFTPAITTVNFTVAQDVGKTTQLGVRVANAFGDYAPTTIPPNPFYGFNGYGNFGLPSGVNGSACATGQTVGCEPFQYNYSAAPYESEQTGPPRLYTFFASFKY